MVILNKLESENICGEEWAEWYKLTPRERWSHSLKLWDVFLFLGGSLDPEPDSQSPFYDSKTPGSMSPHGRPGLRVIRRSGV